jgi:hypothetical protein
MAKDIFEMASSHYTNHQGRGGGQTNPYARCRCTGSAGADRALAVKMQSVQLPGKTPDLF